MEARSETTFEFDHYRRHPWAAGSRYVGAAESAEMGEALSAYAEQARDAALRHYEPTEELIRFAAERAVWS